MGLHFKHTTHRYKHMHTCTSTYTLINTYTQHIHAYTYTYKHIHAHIHTLLRNIPSRPRVPNSPAVSEEGCRPLSGHSWVFLSEAGTQAWIRSRSVLPAPGGKQVPLPQLNLGVHPWLCDTAEGTAGHYTLWGALDSEVVRRITIGHYLPTPEGPASCSRLWNLQ